VLRLHTDDELGALLGTKVTGRRTIHEWPLSCVQRVVLDDGTRLVYKSQLPPTVEPAFYAAVSSPLLPGYRSLGRLGDCETMVLDWIDAPLLRDIAGTADELAAHGRRVITRIGAIGGTPPVYLDLGTPAAWAAETGLALERLGKLVADRRFSSIDAVAVERVRAWATDAAVVDAVTAAPRVVHGDLTAEQVFVTPDGYRVVDWQRPIVAPPAVDLVALLVSRRIPPTRYAGRVAVGVYWFLLLHWALRAEVELFPGNPWPLFERWSAAAVTRILR
jgi:Phosphotransferase enzyme family